MNKTHIPLCRSIFTSGENPPTVERYTQLWIALISQIEKSKEAVATVR